MSFMFLLVLFLLKKNGKICIVNVNGYWINIKDGGWRVKLLIVIIVGV